VDEAYAEGVTQNNRELSNNTPSTVKNEYAFHRRYTIDLSSIMRSDATRRQKRKIMKEAMAKKFPFLQHGQKLESRIIRTESGKVIIAIPTLQQLDETLDGSPPAGIISLREILFNALTRVIRYEDEENRRERNSSVKL
jgi:hypothetical protein